MTTFFPNRDYLPYGFYPGIEEGAKYGGVKNTDALDNSVDVWRMADDGRTNRSDTKTFPTTAQSLYLASDSASDSDVDVLIRYLDANGFRQTATVNTNGTTAVDTGLTGRDSNRMAVTNENQNVGNIYLNTANAHTAGVPDDLATVLCMIPATKGQTQQAIDQVPTGFKYRIAYVMVYCSRASGAAGSADVEIQVMESGGSWVTKRDYAVTTSVPVNGPEAGLVYDAGAKIKAVVVDVSDNDTIVTVNWKWEMLEV